MCNIWPEALAIQKGLDSICIGIDNKKLCEIAGEASKYRIEIQQQLAAANARIAELEKQKPSYKAEFDCVYEKLKAEESLSKHYKQRAEGAKRLKENYARFMPKVKKEAEKCGNCTMEIVLK